MKSSDDSGSPGEPDISVCVPMYNNSPTIARCLRSILDQDDIEFEIIVVDDDSSDDSAAIAATMLRPGDRLIHNQSRLGLNGNHNKCLALAHGRCVQFVHGDDWLLPGALQTLGRYFDDPAVGLAFAPRRVESDDKAWQRQYGILHNRFRNLREHNDGPSLVTQMIRGGKGLHNWVGEPSCVMFRRQLALDAGGFREDIYQLVDLDMWLRIMLRSAVCFAPQELSVRSHKTTSETTNILATRRWWLDQLRVLTWILVDPASPRIVRVVAATWWPPAWVRLARDIAFYGPNRWSRTKTLLAAPFREFSHARALRGGALTLGAPC